MVYSAGPHARTSEKEVYPWHNLGWAVNTMTYVVIITHSVYLSFTFRITLGPNKGGLNPVTEQNDHVILLDNTKLEAQGPKMEGRTREGLGSLSSRGGNQRTEPHTRK